MTMRSAMASLSTSTPSQSLIRARSVRSVEGKGDDMGKFSCGNRP